jgi:hypothetical protein
LGGRTVLSPSPLDATKGVGDYQPGIDQTTVICGYTKTSDEKTFKVTVNYALPVADFNPYADFDLGCTTKSVTRSASTGDLAWSAKGRAYRVVSLTGWSYASFRDPTDQLQTGDISGFETVARTLLKRAAPAAHDCALPGKGGPTAVPPSRWTVTFTSNAVGSSFTTSAALPAGTFSSNAVLTGKAATDVTQLQIPDFTMSIAPNPPCGTLACMGCTLPSAGETLSATEQAALSACLKAGQTAFAAATAAFKATAPPTQSVTFHVSGDALAFSVTNTEAVTLEVPVTVATSTDPSCASGATGTLTLKENPTDEGEDRPVLSNPVTLNVCGAANLLQGSAGATPDASATFTVSP